ncbi:MAG: hypoxanthine phosphoribosyltransferase [Desulfovibrio sp.]|nr:hypoxanthine phosphoribosyltransferase [Desulfovibrio sp.]
MGEELRIKDLRVVFSAEQIAARVREVAAQVDACYGEETLVVVCVLKGGFVFFSDLVRCLQNRNVELDFVRLASYGKSDVSSGHVIFSKDVESDISGKHVLIVEDIVDSGRSMRFLLDQFAARRPRSLRLATLVDKHERRQNTVKADFIGFSLERGFIVGYGLDYAERFRALPGVYEIIPE